MHAASSYRHLYGEKLLIWIGLEESTVCKEKEGIKICKVTRADCICSIEECWLGLWHAKLLVSDDILFFYDSVVSESRWKANKKLCHMIESFREE